MPPTSRTSAARRARLLAVGGAAALVISSLAGPTAPAAAASRWTPAERATITPGVQMFTRRAQCTANFVLTDADRRVYVGYAAHCAGKGEATDTDGCATESHPLGTRVRFAQGADAVSSGTTVGRGRLVYSSWLSMQRAGTRDRDACAANDFALVRVGRRHVRKVNPSVPVFGGPTGLVSSPGVGSRVLSWGQSSLRPTTTLSAKEGTIVERTYGGWSSDVYTVSPGIPGDSGSGFVDDRGRGFGVLSTVALTPYPASNGVSDLVRALRFARAHTPFPRLRLVRGTEPFTG